VILPVSFRRRGLGEVAGVDVGATEHDCQTLSRIGTLGVQDGMNLGGKLAAEVQGRAWDGLLDELAQRTSLGGRPGTGPLPVLNRCDAPTARRR
jgi:hypothetical protein